MLLLFPGGACCSGGQSGGESLKELHLKTREGEEKKRGVSGRSEEEEMGGLGVGGVGIRAPYC